MTSLDAVRARFARNEGLPVRRRPDRGQHPRRPRRARRRVPRPGVQPGHDHLGLPLPGAQRRPQLPRRRRRAIIAHRAASGLEACSPNTASYCNARGRLPTAVLRTLARRTAQQLQAGAARGVEVERAERVHRRRLARLHARHAGEPGEPTRSRWRSSRASASRWPGSPCCCRWRPAPATTWPSRRTRARAPARPPCCGRCTTRSSPATWSSPTPCSTTTSSPASCASRGIDLVARAQYRARGEPDGGERARRRRHRLAAAQQAARDDGGAVPHATPRAC